MRSLFVVATLASALLGGPALAADFSLPTVVTAPGSEAGAACAGAGALARVKRNFAWAEHRQWHRGFVIAQIGNPRPSGHHFAEPGLVTRDYCVADAVMTNGSAYPVYYIIEHGLGFVGLGTDIDSCVPGLDPWHIHDGDCRTVR